MSLHPQENEHQSLLPERPNLRDDPKLASGRIAVFQYTTVAVFLFLISGFWVLQVRDPDVYSERAEKNRIKALPLIAPRGKILDRDGRVIVDNHLSYSLILSRETLKQSHIRPIAEGLNLDYEDLEQRLRRYDRTRPKYEPIIIKEELTPQELAFVESHRDADFFPEMEIIHAERRLYPKDQLAAHLVGYTGEISEKQLDMAEYAHYEQGDIVGKAGIEKQYNEHLRGVDGQRRVVVDSRGRERAVLMNKEPVPGKPLQLTIDLDLQAVAELAMADKKGAVVALDPHTGEVLAMVSRPAYDPNRFAVRIRSADWRDLLSNPDNPLLNRAIQAQFAPGSTFKPIVAMAALESGTVEPETTYRCSGGASFYGHYHKCHQKGGHGTVNLHKGIVVSCDVYFYSIGNRLGIDKIAYYSEMAGLGDKTGIDLPEEKAGLVPSTRWKIRTFHDKWYPGETISVSIGQGALTVTPLQLAHAIGGLAIGGKWYKPHLVKTDELPKPREWTLQPEYVKRVNDGMYGVVNEGGGTGGRARLPGIEVAGKTGSAQLVSNEAIRSGKVNAAEFKDNGWFVGFAPRDNPEIVIAALYENSEHGYLAAPIVRDIIKAHFDKKARRNRLREAAPQISQAPVREARQVTN